MLWYEWIGGQREAAEWVDITVPNVTERRGSVLAPALDNAPLGLTIHRTDK